MGEGNRWGGFGKEGRFGEGGLGWWGLEGREGGGDAVKIRGLGLISNLVINKINT